MMYSILLIGEFILLFIALCAEGEDIMAPSCIVCVVWAFSTICAMYNSSVWGVSIHFWTVITIWLGLLVFITGSFINRNIRQKQIKGFNPKFSLEYGVRYGRCNEISFIVVRKIVLAAIIFLGIATVLLQYRWLTSTSEGSSWLLMMKDYRSSSSSWNAEAMSKSTLLSELEFILKVAAYFTSYIGINNIVADRFHFRYVFYFIPGLLFIIDLLLNAGRGGILYYFGALACVSYVLLQRKYAWSKKFSRKYVKYMFGGAVFILLLFSALRTLVGRTEETDTIYYIAKYAGGSIPLFDMYLENPIEKSSIIGKETFITLNHFIGSHFGNRSLIYTAHKEFRYSQGINLGNVYGTFRPYIQDFGYVGLVVLTFFSSYWLSGLYKRVKYRVNIPADGVDWLLVLYMVFIPAIFMHSISDYTYSDMFNIVRNIKWLVFVVIIKWFMIRKQVNNGG